MMGKTHFLFGCLTFAAVGPLACELIGHPINPVVVLAGVAFAGVAGLLPDIDHPEAFLTKGKLPLPKWVPFKYLLGQFLSVPPRVIGIFVRGVMGHRQGTHSIPFMLFWTIAALPLYLLTILAGLWILTIPADLLGMSFNLGTAGVGLFAAGIKAMPVAMVIVFLGYFSHLFSDSLNTAPVPWLWPWRRKGIFFLPKGLRIKVDSTKELMFRAVTLFALLFFLVLNVIGPTEERLNDGKSLGESFVGISDIGKKDADPVEKTLPNADPTKPSRTN